MTGGGADNPSSIQAVVLVDGPRCKDVFTLAEDREHISTYVETIYKWVRPQYNKRKWLRRMIDMNYIFCTYLIESYSHHHR